MEIYKGGGGGEEWDGGGGYGQEKMSQGPGLGKWRKGMRENGESLWPSGVLAVRR